MVEKNLANFLYLLVYLNKSNKNEHFFVFLSPKKCNRIPQKTTIQF